MKIYRYFIDFTDSQQKWLNSMAQKGWRLIDAGQLVYGFEACNPDEYEYAIEFVADKSQRKSKDYKAFLESMGYRAIYKPINVGIFIGKVKIRPWAADGGRIATSPGGLQKELLILEKKKDSKPFELHSSLQDRLAGYRTLRNAYFWMAGQILAMSVICLVWGIASHSFSINSFYFWIMIICMSLSVVLGIPAMKYLRVARQLKAESMTNE